MKGSGLALTQAATYRALVVTADFFLLWVLLGSVATAGLVTVTRHAIQTILFALHELAWRHVRWGRVLGHALRRRTLVKAGAFRAIALVNDFIILFLFTNAPGESAGIAALVALVNTVLYYAHERAWDRWA